MAHDTQSNPSRFWQASPDYHGVIAAADGCRLVVSPNGTRYLLQVPAPDGTFAVRRHRNRLSKLVPDLPPSITAQDLGHVPDDPGQFPRPWAAETEALRCRVKSAHASSEDYAGTIARDGAVRLVWLASPARYALQAVHGDGWSNVVTSQGAARLCDVVWGRVLPDEDKRAPFVGVRAFKQALTLLPAEASEYRGPKPERIADVAVKRPGDPRRHADRKPKAESGLRAAESARRARKPVPGASVPERPQPHSRKRTCARRGNLD